MAQDEFIELTCPRCGHKWRINLRDLEQLEVVLYRGDAQTTDYRAACPKDGTRVIFTLKARPED